MNSSNYPFTLNRHSELLALAEDFDDMRSTRVLRAVPSRRASAAGGQLHSKVSITPVNNKKKIPEDSESSEESSDVSLHTVVLY